MENTAIKNLRVKVANADLSLNMFGLSKKQTNRRKVKRGKAYRELLIVSSLDRVLNAAYDNLNVTNLAINNTRPSRYVTLTYMNNNNVKVNVGMRFSDHPKSPDGEWRNTYDEVESYIVNQETMYLNMINNAK